MRIIDYEKGFVSIKMRTEIFIFLFVIGSHNAKGVLAEMADAYIDWQIRHLVADGLQLWGGVINNYEGSEGRFRVRWFQNNSRFFHFHQYIRNINIATRNSFWNLLDGPHNNQIYSHVGHLLDRTFGLVKKA